MKWLNEKAGIPASVWTVAYLMHDRWHYVYADGEDGAGEIVVELSTYPSCSEAHSYRHDPKMQHSWIREIDEMDSSIRGEES